MSKKTLRPSGLQTDETIGVGKLPTPKLQTPPSASLVVGKIVTLSSPSLQTENIPTSTPTGNPLSQTGVANGQTGRKGHGIPISTVAETFNWAFRILQTAGIVEVGVKRNEANEPVCYLVRLHVKDGWAFATETGLHLEQA